MNEPVIHKTDQFGKGFPGQELIFACPGCKCSHGVTVTGAHAWSWNQSMERPTFTPSILVQWTEFTEKGNADYEAWVASGCPTSPNEKLRFESCDRRCHSFVTDGQIQFLGDCTHALAGQTVPLQPF